MFSILAIVLLVSGFAVLVITFFWVAHLLAMKSRERERTVAESHAAESPNGEESAGSGDQPDENFAQPHDGEQDPAEAEAAAQAKAKGAIQGATFGLILAILACLLFKYELMIILSVVAIFYCGRALYYGLRCYLSIVWRALIGLLLGILSVGLQFLNLSGQLSDVIPFL